MKSASVVCISKGLVYCPVIWERDSQQMMFIDIVLVSSNIRSDQHGGYFDRLVVMA